MGAHQCCYSSEDAHADLDPPGISRDLDSPIGDEKHSLPEWARHGTPSTSDETGSHTHEQDDTTSEATTDSHDDDGLSEHDEGIASDFGKVESLTTTLRKSRPVSFMCVASVNPLEEARHNQTGHESDELVERKRARRRLEIRKSIRVAVAALSPEERKEAWRGMDQEERLLRGEALVERAKKGDIARTRALIMQGVDVDAADGEGRSALRVAARQGHTKLVQMLVEEFGANVNSQSAFNHETCLHLASAFNRESTIKALVDLGADVKIKNISGQTALDILRTENVELSRWVSNNARTSLSTKEKKLKFGEQLVDAATVGDIDAIWRIISSGTHIDAENSEGSCALRRAARRGHVDMVKLLITEFGANVNGRNKHNGETALHFACKTNRENVVKSLIKLGADCNVRSKAGMLPSDLCQKKNPELAQWVITNADKFKGTTKRRAPSMEKANKLVRAAGAAEVDIIRWLISQRVNVDTEDSEGRCALRTAASVGNAKVVQTLLTEFNAHANAQSRVSGNTALHLACKNNKEDVVKVLVESGADLAIKNKAGYLAHELVKDKNPRLAEWIGKFSKDGGECDDTEKQSSALKDEQLVHVATS